MKLKPFVAIAALTIAGFFAVTYSAAAAPIASIGGGNALLSIGSGGTVLTLDVGSTNTSPYNGGNALVASGYSLGTFNSLTGPLGVGGNFTLTDGTGTATFNLPSQVSLTSSGNGGVFSALAANFAILAGNTSALDFGLIGSKYTFTGSFQDVTLTAGAPGLFSNILAGATSSWTLRRGPDSDQPVPEPASVLLWGSMAAAGLFLRRRNRA